MPMLWIALTTILAMPLLSAAPSKKSEKIIPPSEEEMLAAAHQIDIKVAALLKRKKAPAPADASDSVFLRRSFLTIAGRIPTAKESIDFLESDAPKKRQNLINDLFKSKGYTSHMSNWLLDQLRVRERFSTINASASAYVRWVRKAARNNTPYDKLAHQLISARGGIWSNGAVGYYIRDKGMPLDNLSNSMRLFMGTRMECAQCHDHPFDDWERKEFYELAAFTNGQSEINYNIYRPIVTEINKNETRETPFGQINTFIRNEIYRTSLSGSGIGRIKLPADYQYRDGSPGDWVGARTPTGKSYGKTTRFSKQRHSTESRHKFANWMTDHRNQRFATIITNRMWKRVMGTGLFEPIDEFVEPEETVSPELTRYLVRLMQEMHYDLRAFQHTLMLTRVYGFSTSLKQLAPAEKSLFNNRQLTRLSAEQYWDSLVTLIAGNPDKLPTRGDTDTIYYRGRPVLVGEMTMAQLQKEVLALDSPSKLRKYSNTLVKRFQNSSSHSSASGKNNMSMTMMTKGGSSAPLKGIARASELASPAPVGHLLHTFGQSERLLLEGASKEANTSQVLMMLNGKVESLVVANPNAHIHKNAKGSPRDKIKTAFLGTLSRLPSPDELAIMEAEIATRGDAGFRNVLSALINSREFLFIP